MGLDIYGRANHRRIEEPDEDAREYYFWGDKWADREAGAPDYPHESECVGHAYMSYGGYWHFRRMLASIYLGLKIPEYGKWPHPSDPEDALWKLINYADNEGVFGPPMVKRVAERLAGLDRSKIENDWRDLLDEWCEVFIEAAKYEDGCVEWR